MFDSVVGENPARAKMEITNSYQASVSHLSVDFFQNVQPISSPPCHLSDAPLTAPSLSSPGILSPLGVGELSSSLKSSPPLV